MRICLAMDLPLAVHRLLPGQFRTLTHLGESLRPLLLFHLRCLPHQLHLSPRITLPHRLQFIPICGCQLMHHSQDTPSRICLPSPDERIYTFWTPIDPGFGANNRVSRSVSETMKEYYDSPYPNWTMTPDHVKTTWFKCFAQRWNWSVGITERVKSEFIAKAKTRLCNTVSNWKDKWEIYGYEGKPSGVTKEAWDGLITYWNEPSSIRKANSCSASRRTRDKDGHLPMVH
ncbi:hypothetical protein Bca101_030380 [Brassica carinata]